MYACCFTRLSERRYIPGVQDGVREHNLRIKESGQQRGQTSFRVWRVTARDSRWQQTD
jgi:hypothetical protein